MATSDWTFSGDGAATNLAIPYAPAGPIPAPTGGGSYARSLTATTGGNAYSGFYPSDPSFSNIPYGATPKAIRIQCFFYLPSFAGRSFDLSAKNNPTSSSGPVSQFDGYSLTAWINVPQVQLVLNNNRINLANSFSLNTWNSWRLSVYPVSSTVDRIIAEYESSPGSGVWSSTWPLGSGDVIVDSTSPRYIPWGVRAGKQSRNGVWATVNGANPAYIDLLQVTLANTPTPIP